MLLYSLLYLTGYKSIKLADIKNFRQLNSICAGHPEYEKNSGIETTTGPLGQGLANGVGMALAEKILNKKYGKLVDHKTWVIVGDGCLMEGISQEAISFAGHKKLNKLKKDKIKLNSNFFVFTGSTVGVVPLKNNQNPITAITNGYTYGIVVIKNIYPPSAKNGTETSILT